MKRRTAYIIRKRALGDVLWIEPVIRQLADRYNKVIVYTKYAELFLHYPLSNVQFKSELSSWEKIIWKLESFFKTSFLFTDLEMAYERNPKMHLLHAYQAKAHVPLTTEYPRLYLNDQESMERPVEGNYIVLHLESFTNRNYRKVFGVNWKEIIKHLHSAGLQVVQIGVNPEPIEGAVVIKTSIRSMMGTIKGAAFFIGIDSGPSHIAASLGIPSLIFFGSVNPLFRHFPNIFKGYFLQQPCEYAGCYHETISESGTICRLVGNEGIPKCSLHSTEYVRTHIDLLIDQYHLL